MLEPIVLGIVIGLVCISVAGLFVFWSVNTAGCVRLMTLFSICWFYTPRVIQNWGGAHSPAFAQQLYAFPIDATGKAVCANCHLAEAPIRLSGPSAVFASSIFDLLIEIPTLLTASQVSSAGELLEFADGTLGMALNLEHNAVGAVLFTTAIDADILEGTIVRTTGQVVEIPVGEAYCGRIVNALCEPIDGEGSLAEMPATRPLESPAPDIMSRVSVHEPFATGITAIDAMIPIGRGQRELIIGDRQTGKSTIAIDAVLATNPNVGGVGQSEALLVLQSRERLGTYAAGNRGRGQLYPDGSPSNNGGFRSPCNGWLGRVHISREGPSFGVWTRSAAVQVSRLPAGVDILARRSCQLGARISIDAVLATNPNVGGVGQSEALLVLQSRERLGYYVQVVPFKSGRSHGNRPRRPEIEQKSGNPRKIKHFFQK